MPRIVTRDANVWSRGSRQPHVPLETSRNDTWCGHLLIRGRERRFDDERGKYLPLTSIKIDDLRLTVFGRVREISKFTNFIDCAIAILIASRNLSLPALFPLAHHLFSPSSVCLGVSNPIPTKSDVSCSRITVLNRFVLVLWMSVVLF